MLKRVLTAACMCVLVASVAMAQKPYPTDKPATPDRPTTMPDRPTTDKSSTGRTVTLTGCLQSATEGGGFILTNVTAGTSGTSGTTTPGEPGATATTATKYRLVGTGGQDLTKHVGHKVEITGSLGGRDMSGPRGTTGVTPPDPTVTPGEPPTTEPGAPPTTTPPTTTPPTTTPPSTAASPMAAGPSDTPRLNVKSMKHVSGTCP